MTNSEMERRKHILKAVLEKLAAAFSEELDVPLPPDAVRVEIDETARDFAAFVRPDPDMEQGALIEISLHVVRRLEEAARALELESPAATADAGPEEIHPLVELGLQWVILHEIAHWALGHFGLVMGERGKVTPDVRLAAVEHAFSVSGGRTPAIDDDTYKCLELQADFIATQLLDMIHASEWRDARIEAGGTPSDPGVLSDARQAAVLASGLVILIMESLRKMDGTHGRRHPHPETRAFNVMQVIIGQSLAPLGAVEGGDVYLRPSGDDHIAQIRSVFEPILRIFTVHLAGFARSLDVEPIFDRTGMIEVDFEEGRGEALTVTLRDVLLNFFHPGAPPGRFVSVGAREYARLLPRLASVRAVTAPHAIWT